MKLFRKILQNCNLVHLNLICKLSTHTKSKPLYNGYDMPLIGLGTWESYNEEVKAAIKAAVFCGYRMIDTAYVYNNEKSVGQAIKELIKEKVIKRKNIFITSKLWNTFHQPDDVIKAVRLSLKNLNLTYLDLYLIHWPTAYKEGKELFPRDDKGKVQYADVNFVETWKAMEEIQEIGLAKSIGLSNFNKAQIERIWNEACIKPAVLQCECHPFLTQTKLREYCKSKNIVFTAYSPLGGSKVRPFAVKGEDRLMESKEIIKMAENYQKKPAQILIRFQLQLGNIVIPKSVNKLNIERNFKVFDWKLRPEDMETLMNMNKNHRYVSLVEVSGKHKDYPFNAEY